MNNSLNGEAPTIKNTSISLMDVLDDSVANPKEYKEYAERVQEQVVYAKPVQHKHLTDAMSEPFEGQYQCLPIDPYRLTPLQEFTLMQRKATAWAHSTIIHESLRRNVSNCIAVLLAAKSLGIDEWLAFNQIQVIYNKPVLSSQLIISLINKSGLFTDISYEFVGVEGEDSYGCKVIGTRHNGCKHEGMTVTVGMAKDNEWYDRKHSKWPTLTELMLRYRAVTYFARFACPEILGGFYTIDEMNDSKED